MSTISQYLESDHHHCDAQLADAESFVGKRAWEAADAAFAEFDASLRRHLEMEEKVLFPAFEQTPGTPSGPTAMMRSEHRQIREIAQNMADALLARDADEFISCADTLRILMGQHNMKEESILYPMSDRFLAARVQEIIADMRDLHHVSGVN
jgi:hemerythrin-like domain-containing protein